MNGKLTFIKDQIKKGASDHEWELSYYDEKKELFGFYSEKHKCHMDIYARSFNVITCLNHPSMGVTIMQRSHVGLILIGELMKNPRLHTIKGRIL